MPAFLSRTCLAFLAVTLLLAAPLRPAQAGDLSRAFLLPELFEIMAEEGRRSAVADGEIPLQGRALAEFKRDVAAIYDAETMRAAFEASLMAELASQPDVLADALDFAATELGGRILRLEISARAALLEDEIEEISRITLEEARDADGPRAARLDMVRARIDANDLVDLNVSLGLNTSLAYYRGMLSAQATQLLGADDLLSLVWSQEELLRADIEDWIESYFLLAYQPLSDEDLRTYTEYLSTPFAQAFNLAMFTAFDQVFSDLSVELGRVMGQGMVAEEL